MYLILCQNPILSTAYERGYRDNFAFAGFPGIEKEFAEAQEYFLGSNDTSSSSDATGVQDKVVVDLSCASGFIMRRLIKSNRYKIQLIFFDIKLSPHLFYHVSIICFIYNI